VLEPLTYEEDDFYGFGLVKITSATDVAVYCAVCHLQQHGEMRMSELGNFLSNCFRAAPQFKYGKLKPLVEAHPEKLSCSKVGGIDYVNLCNGSPDSSLPMPDEKTQSEHLVRTIWSNLNCICLVGSN